jgi:hypothetical protein
VDPVRLYATELKALLAEGEWPVAAAMCQQAFGSDRLERSPEEIDRLFRFLPSNLRQEVVGLLTGDQATRDPRAWEKALGLVVDALSGDLVQADPDELIGGISAAGHVGSVAHRLAAALEGRITYCVVTDRRLVFAELDYRDTSFTEVTSIPRVAVLAARREGRLLQRGRVVLDFVDLSRIALMTGIFFTGAADRLVSALNGGLVRQQ